MIFDRFARWFTNWFGSAPAFCVVAACVCVWVSLMAFVGPARWNATLGLAGNTVQSTAELLLAIAIQYTASRVERQQQEHMAAIERLETMIAEHMGITADVVAQTELIAERLGDDGGK